MAKCALFLLGVGILFVFIEGGQYGKEFSPEEFEAEVDQFEFEVTQEHTHAARHREQELLQALERQLQQEV